MSVDLVKLFETPISQSLLQLDTEELRFPGEKNIKKFQVTEEKPKDIVPQCNTNSQI